MQLIINNNRRETLSKTISELLSELDLEKDMVAVELNKEIVHRDKFDSQELAENDTVEIVTVVGGG